MRMSRERLPLAALVPVLFVACSGGGSLTIAPNTSSRTAGPVAGATQSPAPTNAPAPTPKPTPTAVPTPTPAPTATTLVYDPPAGTYPLFPQSPMLQKIPSNPEPDPSSSAWISKAQVGNSIGRFQFFADSSGYASDVAYPIYYTVAPTDPSAEIIKISCSGLGGALCPENGITLSVDSRVLPEDFGISGDVLLIHRINMGIVHQQALGTGPAEKDVQRRFRKVRAQFMDERRSKQGVTNAGK